MYYEVYIDVLFLVNFMMDSLLLLFVGKALKCARSYARIFLSAAIGALSTCVVMFTSFLPSFVKIIVLNTAVNSLMIAVAFQIKSWRLFFRAMMLLYIFAFLFGGILQWFYPYLKTGSIFFSAVIVSSFLIKRIWRFVFGFFSRQQKMCQVILYFEGREISLQAFVDTGNTLKDPLSGQPVHILEQRALAGKTDNWENGCLRYIPFRTVSGEGVMPVIRFEKMCVHLQSKEDIWIECPMIGISKECIFTQEEYQMLLNPEILGGI